MDHEDNEQLMTSKVRTKLASVNNFKEGRKHDQ
jgi:hypothetical protein